MDALFLHALPQACVCLDCVVFCLPGSCSMLRTGDSSVSQRGTWGSEGARDRPGSEHLSRGKASGCPLHQGAAVSTCCLSTKFAARNTRGNTCNSSRQPASLLFGELGLPESARVPGRSSNNKKGPWARSRDTGLKCQLLGLCALG